MRAKRTERLPVVMTRDEVRVVLGNLTGTNALIGRLLYGTGMRLLECLRLRVKDVDFALNQITIREGKGSKDRLTVLPAAIQPALHEHLAGVKQLHDADLAEGFGKVYLPAALSVKYPAAAGECHWQYVFPSVKRSIDAPIPSLRGIGRVSQVTRDRRWSVGTT